MREVFGIDGVNAGPVCCVMDIDEDFDPGEGGIASTRHECGVSWPNSGGFMITPIPFGTHYSGIYRIHHFLNEDSQST